MFDRSRLLVLGSFLLAMTACSEGRRTPAHAPQAILPSLVARDVDLFAAPGGSRVAHIVEGDVLERRGDFIRVQTSGGVVEGWAGVPIHAMAPGRGVGLFAARDVSVVTAQGVRIATASRGAFLPVVRDDGAEVEVALPPFGVTGRVPRSALTARASDPPRRALHTHAVENRRVAVDLGAVQVRSVCEEPVGIVAGTGDDVIVTQVVRGIGILGRAVGRAEACAARVVTADRDAPPPVPDGYRAVRPFRTTAFAASRELTVLEHDDAGTPSCRTWRYRRAPGGRDTLESTYAVGEDQTIASYVVVGAATAVTSPHVLALQGPTRIRHRPGEPDSRSVTRCESR